jgi:hypothetical protein
MKGHCSVCLNIVPLLVYRDTYDFQVDKVQEAVPFLTGISISNKCEK